MRTLTSFFMTFLSLLFICQALSAKESMTYNIMTPTVAQHQEYLSPNYYPVNESALTDNQVSQDYFLLRDSSENQTTMKDLTGEITITEGGAKYEALYYGIIDIYEYVDICYSGPEDVEYTIKVNGNVLNQYSAHWVDSIGGYRVYLSDMIQYGSDWYSVSCNFDITVNAEGYNDLSTSYYTFFSYVPSPPTITGSHLTPDALIIDVHYNYSIYSCNLPEADENSGYYSYCSYKAERLDEDYYVTVFASNRTPMSTVSGFVEEDHFVPARLYGDVDGDEWISINDVSLLIDYLLGNNHYGIYEKNADINHDELITIVDVTTLIDKLLNI